MEELYSFIVTPLFLPASFEVGQQQEIRSDIHFHCLCLVLLQMAAAQGHWSFPWQHHGGRPVLTKVCDANYEVNEDRSLRKFQCGLVNIRLYKCICWADYLLMALLGAVVSCWLAFNCTESNSEGDKRGKGGKTILAGLYLDLGSCCRATPLRLLCRTQKLPEGPSGNWSHWSKKKLVFLWIWGAGSLEIILLN